MVTPLPALTIGTASDDSIGNGNAWVYGPNSITVTANLIAFIPFRLSTPIVVRRLWIANGTVVSGNVDLGVYDAKGTLLVSTGSTPQANTSTIQFIDVDDVIIGPGQFYLAVVIDNATGTIMCGEMGAQLNTILGIAGQVSTFPLPATATLASALSTAAYEPHIGLTGYAA